MQKIALALLLAFAACDSTPKDAAGWAKAAGDKSKAQEKIEAVKQSRKAPGDKKAAVPYLAALLKDAPKVRTEAAIALAEIKDPSAAQPLADALDFGISGVDAQAREGHAANKEIARALGATRSKAGLNPLLKLARSGDNYEKLAAINALGEIGDSEAVDPLMAIATDEEAEMPLSRAAIIALGRIGDEKAAPAIIRMMFRERKGGS